MKTEKRGDLAPSPFEIGKRYLMEANKDQTYMEWLFTLDPLHISQFSVPPSVPQKNDFQPFIINWVVTVYRKDTWVGPKNPVAKSDYLKILHDSCFKNWKDVNSWEEDVHDDSETAS